MIDLNLALLGLILSIVYSSSEIVLISANALQVEVWEKQGKRLSHLASSILDHKAEYLSVILIGTNLSNILTTSFATVYRQIPSLYFNSNFKIENHEMFKGNAVESACEAHVVRFFVRKCKKLKPFESTRRAYV